MHTLEYEQTGTIVVEDKVGLTASIEVLRDIAIDQGPRRAILAFGYAGWGPGQLDNEIQQNAWLNVPADDALIFDDQIESRWERAIAKSASTFPCSPVTTATHRRYTNERLILVYPEMPGRGSVLRTAKHTWSCHVPLMRR